MTSREVPGPQSGALVSDGLPSKALPSDAHPPQGPSSQERPTQGSQGAKLRVAVMMGGPSDEHEVSLRSGQQVIDGLRGASEVDAFRVVVEKSGRFVVRDVVQPSLGAGLEALRAQADVAFIALHGPFGEDGTVQALLEVLGLPYTGSGVAASALAMDKVRTKAVYRADGLPTAAALSIGYRDPPVEIEAKIAQAFAALGSPIVAKPSTLGSSFGLAIVAEERALGAHARRLLELGHDVLLEAYVTGRELTCGVLEVEAERRVFALPVTEIVPLRGHTFFDYVAKYTPGESDEITPARIAPEIAEEVQRLAVAAHRALGCRDMSRTDFIMDATGGLVLLETNTIPGFTATSLLPQSARAAGLDFEALVRLLLENARRRGPRVPLRVESP